MSTETENARKRKAANPLDAVASNDGVRTSAEGKARRVSTETIVAAGNEAPEALNNSPKRTPINTEKLVRMDLLFHPDIVVVESTLDELTRTGLTHDDDKCDKIVISGGCLALVFFLKNRLETLFPSWEPIVWNSALGEGEMVLIERRLLCKTLSIMKAVAYKSKRSVNEFAAIGGIEATIALMKAIPLCGKVQGAACGVLCNLTAKESDVGVARVMAARGMETTITAMRQHPQNRDVCRCACKALFNLILNSKENARLMRNLGGVIAVATVITNWPENSEPFDAASCLNIEVSKMFVHG
jgi:hypothetical protein